MSPPRPIDSDSRTSVPSSYRADPVIPPAPGSNAGPRFHLAIEGGPAWADLHNSSTFDHFGGYGRAEAGVELQSTLLSQTVFFQGGGGVSFSGMGRDFNFGTHSVLDYETLFGNVRGGFRFFGGNLGFHVGVNLGVTHLGAPRCDSGSCGAAFYASTSLRPLDAWGGNLALEFGLSTLHNVVDLNFRFVEFMAGFPHNTNIQIGISLDIMAIVREANGESP